MADRVLPEPEKFASCPYKGSILAYYEGQFESVFVALSPFIRPTTLSIARFCPEEWPTKNEMIAGCEPVPWNRLVELTELQDIRQLDIALRTGVLGLNEKYENEKLWERLKEYIDANDLIMPTEGEVSPFVENAFYEALKSIGYQWAWIGDEFCTERKLHWIDDLIENDEMMSHGCAFTPDKGVLITTHWDSHFSLICSNAQTIELIKSLGSLEGFVCDRNTEVYWSVQP